MARRKEISDNDYFILTVLSGKPTYGYAVRKEIEKMTSGEKRLGIATLYDRLHRLREAGLIEQLGDQEAEGRIRRIYSISKLGGQALQERNRTVDIIQQIRQYQTAVGDI